MSLIDGGRVTGELAAIAAVTFFVASWLYVSVSYRTNTVILTHEDHQLQRDTMHKALADVQKLKVELEACNQRGDQ